MSKWHARHFGVTLKVAAHVHRVDEVHMAGSLEGVDKLVLIMFLQVNGQDATRLKGLICELLPQERVQRQIP